MPSPPVTHILHRWFTRIIIVLCTRTRTNIAYMVTYGTHMINTYVFRLSQLDRVPESKRLALLAPTSFTLPLPPIFSSLLSTRFHVASQRAMTNPDRAIEHDWFCIYSALAYA